MLKDSKTRTSLILTYGYKEHKKTLESEVVARLPSMNAERVSLKLV
jgi:hypothetical protein